MKASDMTRLYYLTFRCILILFGISLSFGLQSNHALSYPVKTVVYGDYTYTLYPEKHQGSKLVIEHGSETKTLSLDFYADIGGWQHDSYPYNIDIAVNRNGVILVYTGYYNDDGAFLLNQYDFDGVIKKENIWVGSEAYGGHRGSVKTLNNGSFLVVWQSFWPNGYPDLRPQELGYVVGRVVSSDVTKLGKTFIISAGSTLLANDYPPVITQDADGFISVAWQEYESVVGGGIVDVDSKPINQLMYGTDGDDTIYGYDGEDKIVGEGGSDTLDGGTGDDEVAGNDGNDQLVGGDGSDSLEGGAGNDQINGDGSLDGTLNQQVAVATNRAKKSKDTVRFQGRFSEYKIIYNSKTKTFIVQDKVRNRDGKDVVRNVESFRFKDVRKSAESLMKPPSVAKSSAELADDGEEYELTDDLYTVEVVSGANKSPIGRGADEVRSRVSVDYLSPDTKSVSLLGSDDLRVTGNTLDNTITGNSGDNVLMGGVGHDKLIGGAGDDTFFGGTVDVLGAETDTVSFETSLSPVRFSLSNTSTPQDTISAGYDRLTGKSSIENLIGGAAQDTLIGSVAANVLQGGDGDDVLLGLGGADTLVGNSGRDVIDAGADRDADIVVILATSDSPVGVRRDVVKNFTSGMDVLDLSNVDANIATTGKQSFAFNGFTAKSHSIWMTRSGLNVIVEGDVNGDAVADFEVLIENMNMLGAEQIRL
jgi:Ca2+-binding RTX toxin-like protein